MCPVTLCYQSSHRHTAAVQGITLLIEGPRPHAVKWGWGQHSLHGGGLQERGRQRRAAPGLAAESLQLRNITFLRIGLLVWDACWVVTCRQSTTVYVHLLTEDG